MNIRISSMPSRIIVQIVPRRSSVPDGVGDYATLLAGGLKQQAGIDTVFVQGTTAEIAPPRSDQFRTTCLSARSPEDLERALAQRHYNQRPTAVVCHVSLYGYDKRGVPGWLVTGLARWREAAQGIACVLVFHELWIERTFDPLTSSFWLRPVQRHLIGRLASLADAIVVTTESYQQRLLDHIPIHVPIACENVFSNVGEPTGITPVAQRPRRLVVFSGPGLQRLTVTRGDLLRDILAGSQCDEILEIGTQVEKGETTIEGAQVKKLGGLSAMDVSRHLSTSRFGLLPYGNKHVLAKSGVFAAYAAHGVIPIALKTTGNDADGLVEGRHYLAARNLHRDDLQSMQNVLGDWYGRHSLSKQVARFVDLVNYLNDVVL